MVLLQTPFHLGRVKPLWRSDTYMEASGSERSVSPLTDPTVKEPLKRLTFSTLSQWNWNELVNPCTSPRWLRWSLFMQPLANSIRAARLSSFALPVLCASRFSLQLLFPLCLNSFLVLVYKKKKVPLEGTTRSCDLILLERKNPVTRGENWRLEWSKTLFLPLHFLSDRPSVLEPSNIRSCHKLSRHFFEN